MQSYTVITNYVAFGNIFILRCSLCLYLGFVAVYTKLKIFCLWCFRIFW